MFDQASVPKPMDSANLYSSILTSCTPQFPVPSPPNRLQTPQPQLALYPPSLSHNADDATRKRRRDTLHEAEKLPVAEISFPLVIAGRGVVRSLMGWLDGGGGAGLCGCTA